jgi:hypothetical protein
MGIASIFNALIVWLKPKKKLINTNFPENKKQLTTKEMEDEGKLLSNKNDEIEELTQALDLLNDEINTLVELLERRGILTNQRSLMISCSNADG